MKRKELEGIESLENYLFITARNLIMNYFRSQKRNAAFLERLGKYFSDASLNDAENVSPWFKKYRQINFLK